MAAIPVISNRILHGIPAFIRQEMGQKAPLQARSRASHPHRDIFLLNFNLTIHVPIPNGCGEVAL